MKIVRAAASLVDLEPETPRFDAIQQFAQTVTARGICHAHRVWSAAAALDMTFPAGSCGSPPH